MHTKATHKKAISAQLIAGPPRSFGFAHFFCLFLSKKWLIMLFAALSLTAAIIYLKRAPKLYESRTVVEVEDKTPRIKNLQDFDTGNSGEQDINLAETLKTTEQALCSFESYELTFCLVL
jgi:uncharacterized protein involved in exopolysaccharide biosynthesis